MRGRTAALGLALGLTVSVTACGGGGSDDGGGTADGPAADAAITSVVNPSETKGGTLKFAMSGTLDSADPGDTYYAMVQNFSRLYGRTLIGYRPAPGDAGLELVPDLAEGLGTPSNGNRTWTYKIKKGVKYEDGTEVTAADVKYAIARSNFAKDVLPNGPSYFAALTGSRYKGPYKDPNLDHLTEIATPDDHTLVVNFAKPFADMDYLMTFSQTMPVPQRRDRGTSGGVNYKKHVFSTGPYRFEGNGYTTKLNLVRNPHWDPRTDPLRTGLPDRIELAMKMDSAEIDRGLKAGTVHVDLAGTGVQVATGAEILSDPALRKYSDAAY
ncbi:MAG: ABC transporter substrate-binding protein, partial [Actinomadura sp.]